MSLLTADQARELAAGTTHEDLLNLISGRIADAARAGRTRIEVEEGGGVRGISDWGGADDDTVIGRTARVLRKAGYTVKKTVTGQRQETSALAIGWTTKVTPAGGYLER